MLTIEADHVVGRFSARGDALVVGTPDRFICYDVPSWRERWTADREWADALAGVVAHAPDGSFVAVGHTRFQLRLLDPATGAEIATLRSPDMHELNDAAVSPDSRTIMCTTVDSVVQRWRLDILRAALRDVGEGMDIFSDAR
jgi:WD40 repeat protein